MPSIFPGYRTPNSRQGFNRVYAAIVIVALSAMMGLQAQDADSEQVDPDGLYRAGDYRRALDIWMIQAFEGNAQSQFRVGVIFSEGTGVAQDFEQSAYWYTQAARQGHNAAQYNLGHAYITGTGIEQDENEALRWWEAAAEGGHELAQYNLGRAYYMGIGRPKNSESALFWFSQAAANGEPRSQEILDRLGWEPVAAIHLTPAAEPEPGESDNRTVEAADIVVNPASPGTEPPAEQPAASNDAVATVASSAGLYTQMSDVEPSPDAPVGAPLETHPPVSPMAPVLPEAAPPQNLVTSPSNWSPRPDPTSISLDNAVGAPLEHRPPVQPTPPAESTPQQRVAELVPDQEELPTNPGVAAESTKPELIVTTRNVGTSAGAEAGHDSPPRSVANTDSAGAEDRDLIRIYSAPGTGGQLMGIVDGNANWRVIDRSGAWLRVTRSPGFPVWIHRDQVVPGDGFVTVSGDRVNIRATPDVENSTIVGAVRRGQQFEIISENGAWIRIVSPTNLAAWVEEQELNRHSVKAAAPGGGESTGWQSTGYRERPATPVKDDEAWLFGQPPAWFTIQIISLANEQGIIDFIGNLDLPDDLRYFTSVVDDNLWYVLRYGSYPSYEAARDASRQLPVTGQTIWVRNFGILHRDRCTALENAPPDVREGLDKWCGDQATRNFNFPD